MVNLENSEPPPKGARGTIDPHGKATRGGGDKAHGLRGTRGRDCLRKRCRGRQQAVAATTAPRSPAYEARDGAGSHTVSPGARRSQAPPSTQRIDTVNEDFFNDEWRGRSMSDEKKYRLIRED